MDHSTEQARHNMIQQQIRPWKVLDAAALDVMAEIPREAFVPDAYRALAYTDVEIPLGEGASMLPPKLVGHLLQALGARPGDRALEIGTGSGYVAACLSRMGARVVSVEIDPDLAAAARARLSAQGFERIEVIEADGLAGPTHGGPFDIIAVTGSMPTDASLPMLQGQLTIGGRIFCILGEAPVMECVRITRLTKDDFRREPLVETCIEPLRNVVEPVGFLF